MTRNSSRRDFLKMTGIAGGSFLLVGCSKNDLTAENRNIIDRIFGRPITQLPQIENAWSFQEDLLKLDMSKLPELGELGGAVRLEGDILPDPILVFQGEDGEYYAFKNACTHAGRRVDPISGTMTLECCSVSTSTFDYEGNVLSGPADDSLTKYDISLEGESLIISLS